MEEFLKLRRRLHDALNKASEEYPGKSYEGEMSIEIHYPGIYDEPEEYRDEPDAVVIRADFYLIGPTRHYVWKGTSIAEAVVKATKDIEVWIAGWKDGENDAVN